MGIENNFSLLIIAHHYSSLAIISACNRWNFNENLVVSTKNKLVVFE